MIEARIQSIRDGSALSDPDPTTLIKKSLRNLIWAEEGKKLLIADWSSIENRVLGWVAGDEAVLKVFLGGLDPYLDMASDIYGKPYSEIDPESDERQIGKVAILGLGFGMGWEKFKATVKDWTGIEISEVMAKRVVNTFRDKFDSVVQFWKDCNTAAMTAIRNPNQVVEALHKIDFKYVGDNLWLRFPSGRKACYPFAKIKTCPTPWGMRPQIIYKTINQRTRKFQWEKTYGGKLCENIVQGIARDLLVEALVGCEEEGLPVVAHVHDEIVCEVGPEKTIQDLERVMLRVPAWASGLPVEVKGFEAKRFRK